MPRSIDRERVALRPPKLPSAGDAAALLDLVQAELAADVFALAELRGTGHETGDRGGDKHAINTAMAKLSVLDSRLGDRLEAVLEQNGRVDRAMKARIRESRVERQPLDRSQAIRFGGLSQNPGTTAEILAKLYRRRTKTAKAEAKRLEHDPTGAADASNDTLQIHAWMDDPEARARTLVDTLLQFRAEWRTTENMDHADGPRDTSQGKIASSGIVGTFEARLAAQEAPAGDDFASARERALVRLAVVNHPQDAVSNIFLARNLASSLRQHLGRTISVDLVGEGIAAIPLYAAIHQSYSASTPSVVDTWVRQKVFTGGAEADRVDVLSVCVEAARDPDVKSAKRRLARLEAKVGYTVPGAQRAKTADALKKAVLDHLAGASAYKALKKKNLDDRLEIFSQALALRSTVCELSASDVTLKARVFYGKDAERDVATLIQTLQAGDTDAILEAAGRARIALAKAFEKTTSGFDRQMLWRLDRQVEQIHAAELGTAVLRLREPSDDPAELGRGLLALRSALRGTVASGLPHLRHRDKTAPVEDLDVLLARADRMIGALEKDQRVDVGEVRALMREVLESATEVANAISIMFRRREKAVYFSGADVGLDPEVTDNLIKETALHSLIGLAQVGSSWGIRADASADRITLSAGMRVLNPVGPAVYERVLVADDLEELARLGPTQNDFCVVKALDEGEKALVAVGGLAFDAGDAPPGFSHVSVFARGQGISALAFENLAGDYLPFFERMARQDAVGGAKLYVDDSNGEVTLMPVKDALREGRIQSEADVLDLLPGASYVHRYHDSEKGLRELLDEHRVERGALREVREVDVLVPDLEKRHPIADIPTLEELSTLPSVDDMVQNAGMKGAVLADLMQDEELKTLGIEIPGGSVVPPHVVVELLRKADVYDDWVKAYLDDAPAPADLSSVKASDVLGTRFYTDRDHRAEVVERLGKRVRDGLRALLLDGRRPSAEGRTLLEALARSKDLQGRPWIVRSSQTIEDLLHKSGAGQHTSVADLTTDRARLEGLIEVIASHWTPVAIDNNVAGEMNLMFDWPSVVVERTVKTSVSGVAVSRGERGQLGKVGYQAVPGRGGAVSGAKTWELGHLGQWDHDPEQMVKGRSTSLLTKHQRWQLWRAVRVIEKRLNERFAPGSEVPLAVDVEWGIEKGKLCVYQARFATGYG